MGVKTTVVHVNSPEWAQAVEDGTAVYIGRAVPRKGFASSRHGNPFKIGKDGTREDVLAKYEACIRTSAQRHSVFYGHHIMGLRGKVLGCWCKPEACHGDVLAKLADMSGAEYQAWLFGS